MANGDGAECRRCSLSNDIVLGTRCRSSILIFHSSTRIGALHGWLAGTLPPGLAVDEGRGLGRKGEFCLQYLVLHVYILGTKRGG